MFVIKEGTAPDKVGEGTPPEVIDSINKFLEQKGYVIRTADQEKEFLGRMSNQDVNKALRESHEKFEATIFETTGIQKLPSEKSYDYHKRALSEKLTDVKALTEKIKEFEQKGLQGSDLAKQYKQELLDAQKQIASLNSDWEKKLQDKDNEVFSTRINTDVEKVVAKIRSTIDPTIRPELIEDIISARLAKFNNENKPVNLDGMIVFKDPSGVTRTGKKDGKPLGIEEIISNYFVDLQAKPRAGGAGSGEEGKQPAGGTGATSKWKEIVLPESIKTKVQLTDYLSKDQKLDASTKEYSEAFESLGANLPLR